MQRPVARLARADEGDPNMTPVPHPPPRRPFGKSHAISAHSLLPALPASRTAQGLPFAVGRTAGFCPHVCVCVCVWVCMGVCVQRRPRPHPVNVYPAAESRFRKTPSMVGAKIENQVDMHHGDCKSRILDS